jgi:hypothetical protein
MATMCPLLGVIACLLAAGSLASAIAAEQKAPQPLKRPSLPRRSMIAAGIWSRLRVATTATQPAMLKRREMSRRRTG